MQESKPIEAALAQAWQDIQSIKDVISKYTSGFKFDESSAMESFHTSFLSLSEGYAKWGADIPESARAAWHNAKGRVAATELRLTDVGRTDGDAPLMSPSAKESLREIRTVLTDCQMAIVESRLAVRDTSMKRVLELM